MKPKTFVFIIIIYRMWIMVSNKYYNRYYLVISTTHFHSAHLDFKPFLLVFLIVIPLNLNLCLVSSKTFYIN